MKLRRFKIQNARSFLDSAELKIDGEISIVIGPNGGGKTNLLDIIGTTLRRHFLTSWMSRKSATQEAPDRYEIVQNDVINSLHIGKHNQGESSPQRFEIDLEVTARDIENMSRMKSSALKLQELQEKRYVGTSISEAHHWNLEQFVDGQVFTYEILNNNLQSMPSNGAEVFRRYLSMYEVDSWFRAELLNEAPLSTPMLFLPVNRAGGAFNQTVGLASYNEYDYKRGVDAAHSRASGSIGMLAIGRLARKHRELEARDDGKANATFFADPQVQALSEILSILGYSWTLKCTDVYTNQYDIYLDKQGSSFSISAASSGEIELLIYLFAIFALNVKDALIIVDEPAIMAQTPQNWPQCIDI